MKLPRVEVREAAITYKRTRRPRATGDTTEKFDASTKVAEWARAVVPDAPQEHVVVLALDGKNHAIAWTTLAKGTSNFCAFTPADVFRFVLLAGAVGFVLVHNHPSGDTSPSSADLSVTRRIQSGAEIVGLVMLDHVIISHGARASHYSFLDAGLLAPRAA